MDAWKLGMWGWALLSAPAAAQEVYRCTRGGEVAYQARPCEGSGAQQRWRIAVHPPPSVSPRPVSPAVVAGAKAGRPTRRLAPARKMRRPRAQGVAIGVGNGDGARCEAVRAQRAKAYERAGLKRGFALSSQWDNRVQQACQ